MTPNKTRIAGMAISGVALVLAAAPAQAATTQIGAVEQIAAGEPADTPDGQLVQAAEAPGTRSFAVPAGYGVITAWRHRTGDAGGPLTFKVYRPTANPAAYLALAATVRTVVPGQLHTFPVSIPVQPGDRLGLSADGFGINVAYETEVSADRLASFGDDPPVGTIAQAPGGPLGYRMAVAAVVETDFDRDGRGDDSQDADDDNDGVADTLDPAPLNAALPADSDGDGAKDPVDADDDNDLVPDTAEAALRTNPLDRDSDDDGLADGREDRNRDGKKGKKETSARKRDSDGDRITDGVERGVRKPVADPVGAVLGTDPARFKRDKDPKTKTNPLRKDTDKDGLRDGKEDKNRDGKVGKKESSPKSKDTDKDGTGDKRDDAPRNRRVD